MKTLLILVDGMRPDALADIPEAQAMLSKSSYSLHARTVFPSVTLPCHMSLFHSVDPERHGTTTNVYMPQVRPVQGLCEQLAQNKKSCAFFYNWEELRDLSRPGHLDISSFHSGHAQGYEASNHCVTQDAIHYIKGNAPDFAFVYLGWVDHAGHDAGWMSGEYMHALRSSWQDIQRLVSSLLEEYTVIVTADHGGHGRAHGLDIPEDMTIPVILHRGPFAPGEKLEDVNIKDIAPTIAALLDTEAADEWEGKSLV